ncbi:hypothetical protein PF005_g23417 [Phytophthora fragariae]|uniref:Reverse transcriptase RNase H-like domain-containing protein n=1 Tax=Phytophthora fragariae TaxID=53985 RepID=A0A6A3W7C2_9STRA|nr:hypothetical protein PF011_g22324 [Phytophthora fragariae]KAE9180117.1 hypothetical protein PF005_g23417 [Phytophthora fragariae]KAE9189572.1 hypothetical protein PF002_g25000 [Phytophthora fragariae]
MASLMESVVNFPVPKDAAAIKSFKVLTRRSLLAYPDFSKPFTLVTDASKVGFGAALTQEQGQGEQPVVNASKVNAKNLAQYGITDLECAAVIWVVNLVRPYLYDGKFRHVTNHAELKWLMTSKDLTGRVHRWALQLQEYDFEIVYRPGKDNVVADALSRAPLVDGEIAAEQVKDKTVQSLKNKKKVQSCHDCGSRNARATEVIPPLQSQGAGDAGDRWALDVADPVPVTDKDNRYVVAAVDYATRYAVVAVVPDIANFIVEKLVMVYGTMRELVMDGAES